MRIQSFLSVTVAIFFSFTVFSQELYIPRNIKNAYKNHTRDKSGKPGKNYWQNQASYHIKIDVAPPNRTVKGSEEIVYSNNSPDTLKKLNFKLIINNHKPTSQRARGVSEDYLISGIHIDKYMENGEVTDWPENMRDGTDKFITLQKPMAPGDKIKLNIDWHYKVSKQSGREGAISENTFFIGYFYPRVAVYDDYAGWDRMPHTLAEEFYNDFNDYTFEVTVPENFIVWATGELQNPKAVLQPHYADLFEKSKTSDTLIHIATQEDLDHKNITQQKTNTWKFKATYVTDVALAVSNEYKWDASSLELNNGKRVSTQAAYDKKSTDFEQMVGFIKHSLQWFSENMPGIPYPYPTMTIVRGFADMEFPMMANDSSHPDKPIFTRFVAEHEISHTYFPFYMGTNETRFGFMDEGWATTFEYLIGINDLGKEKATSFYQNFRVKSWVNDPSFAEDLPIIIPTYLLNGAARAQNEYGKASLGYLALRDLLGAKKFKETLQRYMSRWKGKHPMPWDFFYSFNDLSGRNLNWFWSSWFFSNGYIDYAIEKVKVQNKKTVVTLKNIGGFPAPVDIIATLDDDTKKRFHQTPEIWKENDKTVQITLKNVQHIKELSLDGGIFMDADPSNNSWKK